MSTNGKLNRDSFYEKFHQEGCKRLTIPLEKIEHLQNTIDVLEFITAELLRISKQRVPQYSRLLHARMLIGDANQNLKCIANGNITKTQHYKGAV